MDEINLVKEAFEQGREFIGCGAIVKKDGKILILKRKLTDSFPSMYDLPGGGVEINEKPSEGTLRELKEETNLDGKIIKYLNQFDYETRSGKKVRQLNFLVDVKETNNIILTEHDDFKWVEKKDLENFNISEQTKNAISQVFD